MRVPLQELLGAVCKVETALCYAAELHCVIGCVLLGAQSTMGWRFFGGVLGGSLHGRHFVGWGGVIVLGECKRGALELVHFWRGGTHEGSR